MPFSPVEINTSDSWAVNTPSDTCQQWLMSNARSLSLSLSLCHSLSLARSPVLSVFTHHKHTLTATHANHHIHAYAQHIHTHTHRLPHTDSWGVTLLARSPETQRKMDRQELSVRTQEHEVGFSLQIMNHMWSVNSAPIRSDDNYLSTSQSS